MQFFASSDGISYLKVSCIRNTHNIPWVRFVHNGLLLSHKGGRCCKPHHLSSADMFVVYIALKFARANLHKSNTTTVVRIHVSMDFKHESRKI